MFGKIENTNSKHDQNNYYEFKKEIREELNSLQDCIEDLTEEIKNINKIIDLQNKINFLEEELNRKNKYIESLLEKVLESNFRRVQETTSVQPSLDKEDQSLIDFLKTKPAVMGYVKSKMKNGSI